MAASTTVRVSVETRERLRRIGERRGLSTPALVEEMVRHEEERHEVVRWADDLRELSDEQLRGYRAEAGAWEATSADGLDDRPA